MLALAQQEFVADVDGQFGGNPLKLALMGVRPPFHVHVHGDLRPDNGGRRATIAFTTNDPTHATLVVSLTGTGVVTTAITINAPSVTYNANGTVTLTVASTPTGFNPPGNVTLTVDAGTPASQPLVNGSATFTIPTPNAGSHTLFAAYATQSGFQGSTASGTLTVIPREAFSIATMRAKAAMPNLAAP